MRAPGWRRAWLPCLIGLLVFVIQCRGTMTCFDSMWSVPTAISIWDHGDANLDAFLPAIETRDYVFTEWHRGHVYTMFPLGTSLLVAPLVPLLRSVATIVMRADPARVSALEQMQDATRCHAIAGEPIVRLHSLAELVVASTIVAITTMVMFGIARAEGLSALGAAVVAIIFAFGTSAWSTASRSLWQHGPSMLVLSLALLVQVRGRLLPLGGALLAFSYVIRPTNSVALACGLLWATVTRSWRAVGFVLGAAVVLGLFFAINRRLYGAVLPPYYKPGRLGSSTFWVALAGNIISPARGLLIFSPILAFGALGIVLKIRERRFGWLDVSLVACIVLHWIAIASFPHWWGGYSYGPRFFTDMLPYLTYFLIPVVAWIPRVSGARRFVVTGLFAACALFSVFAHAEGALTYKAILWNHVPRSVDDHPERLWDWHDPQVLAGVNR
jgi:hypothetical protein